MLPADSQGLTGAYMHPESHMTEVTIGLGDVADAVELSGFAARTFGQTFGADNNPDVLCPGVWEQSCRAIAFQPGCCVEVLPPCATMAASDL